MKKWSSNLVGVSESRAPAFLASHAVRFPVINATSRNHSVEQFLQFLHVHHDQLPCCVFVILPRSLEAELP